MLRISPWRRISSGLYLLLWTVSPHLYPVRASGQRNEYLTISTAVTPLKSDSIEREASRVVVPMLIYANVVQKKVGKSFSVPLFLKKRIWQPCFWRKKPDCFLPKASLSNFVREMGIPLTHLSSQLLGVGWLAFTTESLSWPLIFFLSSQLKSLTHSVHCVGHSHTHSVGSFLSLSHSCAQIFVFSAGERFLRPRVVKPVARPKSCCCCFLTQRSHQWVHHLLHRSPTRTAIFGQLRSSSS